MDSTCIHISNLFQSRQDLRYINNLYYQDGILKKIVQLF